MRGGLGKNLKFYTNVAKELKLKIRKFWVLIPTFVEVTGEKLIKGGGDLKISLLFKKSTNFTGK